MRCPDREQSNCQELWMTVIEDGQAATFWSCVRSWLSWSCLIRSPSSNGTPASTSATSSWPLNRRQRSLGGIEQLVGHRERRLLGAGALGDARAAGDPVPTGHLIRPSEVDDVGSQEGRGRGVAEQQRGVALRRAGGSPGGGRGGALERAPQAGGGPCGCCAARAWTRWPARPGRPRA